jgi:hypothetical protein
MAIAAEVLFRGGTTEQYDESVKAMGLTPGGQHPGALFHWATNTDAGVKVTDVWASKEEMQQFVAEHVLPATRAVGLADPEVRLIEVHNYMVGR